MKITLILTALVISTSSFAQSSYKEEIAQLQKQKQAQAAARSQQRFNELLPTACALVGITELTRQARDEAGDLRELISLLSDNQPKNSKRIEKLDQELNTQHDTMMLLSRCQLDLYRSYNSEFLKSPVYISSEDKKRNCTGTYAVQCGDEIVEVTRKHIKEFYKRHDKD